MRVLVSFSYPVRLEKMVDKQLFDFRKAPDYLVREGPCISAKVGDSFRSMCIFEVYDNRIEDASQYFYERLESLSELPGFAYEFKPLSKIEHLMRLKGGL